MSGSKVHRVTKLCREEQWAGRLAYPPTSQATSQGKSTGFRCQSWYKSDTTISHDCRVALGQPNMENMDKILTPEEIQWYKEHYLDWPYAASLEGKALLGSHEVLREQLTEARADIQVLATALGWHVGPKGHHPLCSALRGLDCSPICQQAIESLARPGVKRVMEEHMDEIKLVQKETLR